MKKTWQGIKEIINLNNKLEPKISQLNYGKQINTNEGMSNAFNDFFTKIGPKLDKGPGILHNLSHHSERNN